MDSVRIIVRNNDPNKAYKVLMKKLNKEGFFKELREKRYYQTRGEKKRAKHKIAVREQKRNEVAILERLEKQEQRQLIESKKQARRYKKQPRK